MQIRGFSPIFRVLVLPLFLGGVLQAQVRDVMPRTTVLSGIAVGTSVAVLKSISLEGSVSRQMRLIQFQSGRELPKGESVNRAIDFAQVFGTLPNTTEIPAGNDYIVCGLDSDSKYLGFDIRKSSCDPRKAKKGSFWIYYAFGADGLSRERTLSDLFDTLGMTFEFR